MAKTDRSVPFKTACAVFDARAAVDKLQNTLKVTLKYFQNNLSTDSNTEPHETFGQDRIKLSIMDTFSHIDTELQTLLKPAFDLGLVV